MVYVELGNEMGHQESGFNLVIFDDILFQKLRILLFGFFTKANDD